MNNKRSMIEANDLIPVTAITESLTLLYYHCVH